MAKYSFDGSFEGCKISGGKITKGGKSYPLAGAYAQFERGEHIDRLTASRIVLTGIFALALKKDKSKVYVVVQLADGDQLLIESKAKNAGDALTFANKINKGSAAFSK